MDAKRRFAQLLPWLIAWGAILVACVVAGAITRASYTDFTSDQAALMELRYKYIPYTTEEIELSAEMPESGYVMGDALIDTAEIIVECEFTGEREYSYQAFLSQVSVSRVIKGDADLAGTIIPVYEPVNIQKRNIGIYSPEEKAALSERFEYSEGSDFYQLEVQDAYSLGGTMMAESGNYVLFLEERRYPEAEDRTGKLTEYVLCRSPYSKLSLEPKQTPENYVLPESIVTLSDSLSYEIMAADIASAHEFFKERDDLLQRLGV